MSYDDKETSVYGGQPYELYKFTMGVTSWHLTSGDVVRSHMGNDYTPETIACSEIELNNETTSGTINVTLPISSSLVSEFIPSLPPQPMWLTIYAGHDGDNDVVVRRKGLVVQAKLGEVCDLTVAPQTIAIRKKIPPSVYQQSCNRIHYSAACGALMTENGWEVKIESITAEYGGPVIVVDLSAEESEPFVTEFGTSSFTQDEDAQPRLSYGFMITSSGQRMMILDHSTPGIFRLKAPVDGLQSGDTVVVVRGCRRTLKHCTFYERTNNFLGFDVMPSSNPFLGVA
jgi:hypothetical protein